MVAPVIDVIINGTRYVPTNVFDQPQSDDGLPGMPMSPDDHRLTIGQRLARLRESRNISRGRLAELARIGRNVIDNAETNVTIMRCDSLIQVLRALNASPVEVMWALGLGVSP